MVGQGVGDFLTGRAVAVRRRVREKVMLELFMLIGLERG